MMKSITALAFVQGSFVILQMMAKKMSFAGRLKGIYLLH
jgi:hypothetical protein